MPVVVYKSTDASAPVLTGEVDKMRQVLLACLVNGYGAKVGAGWTQQFSGVNKAVFKQGGGNLFFMRIQDDGLSPLTDAKEAALRGAETATDIDLTGDAAFPTAAQSTAGVIARKATLADATARAWWVYADNRTVHIFTTSGDANRKAFSFGDIFSVVTTDAYRTHIMGQITANSGAAGSQVIGDGSGVGSSGNLIGHFLARAYTGVAGAIGFAKHGDPIKSGGTKMSQNTGAVTYPNPADGGLYLAPIWVTEGLTVRGRLRGLWQILHNAGIFALDDVFQGTGVLAGKIFAIQTNLTDPGATLASQIAVETSDTWETN